MPTCDQCDGNYKCDTGYGENRGREMDDGECPVCDSDPNGEHQDWFIDYLGYKDCYYCGVIEECDCEDIVDKKLEVFDEVSSIHFKKISGNPIPKELLTGIKNMMFGYN